jgi:TRAP-type mannitol/chloroaromatic compound transport system substrate-binding protein
MCAEIGAAVKAMSGPATFQALQTGALDAGEFSGPCAGWRWRWC